MSPVSFCKIDSAASSTGEFHEITPAHPRDMTTMQAMTIKTMATRPLRRVGIVSSIRFYLYE